MPVKEIGLHVKCTVFIYVFLLVCSLVVVIVLLSVAFIKAFRLVLLV